MATTKISSQQAEAKAVIGFSHSTQMPVTATAPQAQDHIHNQEIYGTHDTADLVTDPGAVVKAVIIDSGATAKKATQIHSTL